MTARPSGCRRVVRQGAGHDRELDAADARHDLAVHREDHGGVPRFHPDAAAFAEVGDPGRGDGSGQHGPQQPEPGEGFVGGDEPEVEDTVVQDRADQRGMVAGVVPSAADVQDPEFVPHPVDDQGGGCSGGEGPEHRDDAGHGFAEGTAAAVRAGAPGSGRGRCSPC